MGMPRILLVSLRFAPVHPVICRALGEPLRLHGWEPFYLFSEEARSVGPLAANPEAIACLGRSASYWQVAAGTLGLFTARRGALRRRIAWADPDVLLLESPHPANELVVRLARDRNPALRTWLYLHEPYVREREVYGVWRRGIIGIHDWLVRRLLCRIDGVLLPSLEAGRQLDDGYPNFPGERLMVPLLHADRWRPSGEARRYVTFVGKVAYAKGIDRFLGLIEAAAANRDAWEFQLVTSTPIAAHLKTLSAAGRERLRIVCKPDLQDAEIDAALAASIAVVAPYRRVTQSGVVPVAFMHGTPIVATPVGGMPETVVPGRTGVLLPQEAGPQEWLAALREIRDNFPRLSGLCRREFLERFDSRHAPALLAPILTSGERGR